MFKAQDIALSGKKTVQLPQPDKGRHLLQDLLLVGIPQGDILGDEIRKIPHIPAVHHRRDDLIRHAACQFGVLAEKVPGLAEQRLGPGTAAECLGGFLLHQRLHIGLQEGLRLPQTAQTGTVAPLHHYPHGIGGQPQDLADVGNGADLIQILFRRRVDTDLPLRDQEDLLVRLHGPLQSGDGDAALHIEGQTHVWKNRQAPEGQNGNIHSHGFHRVAFLSEG